MSNANWSTDQNENHVIDDVQIDDGLCGSIGVPFGVRSIMAALAPAATPTFDGLGINTTDFTTTPAYIPKVIVAGAGPAVVLRETDTVQEWTMAALGGDFVIRDDTGPTAPVKVEAGAPTDSVVVGSTGAITMKRKLNLSDDSTLPILNVDYFVATPAADTEIGRIGLRGEDSAGNAQAYAQIRGYVTDDTDGSESGYLTILTPVNGTPTEHFRVNQVGVRSAGYVKTASTTVASLPSASQVGAGSRHFVTDATSTTFLSTVAGGGSNAVPVVSDGTNWLIG